MGIIKKAVRHEDESDLEVITTVDQLYNNKLHDDFENGHNGFSQILSDSQKLGKHKNKSM